MHPFRISALGATSRVHPKDIGTILAQPICLVRKQQAWLGLQWKSGRRLQHESSKDSPSPTRSKVPPADFIKDRVLSIPGPSWLWTQVQPLTYPLRAYGRAQNRYPYLVQILSSLTIYFLGDLSSQFIQRSSPSSAPTAVQSDGSGGSTAAEASTASAKQFQYDPDRSLRAFVIGGLFSLPSYHWFLFLSRNFNLPQTTPYSTVLSLVIKIVVNQIVFAPLFNTYFFGMQSLLSSYSSSATSILATDHGQLSDLTVFEGARLRLRAAWERVKETVPISWYNSCKFWPLVTAFSFTFVKPQSRSVFAGIVAIGWQSYLGIVNQRAVEKGNLSRDTR